MPIGPAAAARSTARSWVRRASGCCSASRRPRTPRNGLASGGGRHVAQRLVGAGVEGAHHHAPAAERPDRLLVGLRLLVLGRRLGAVEEEELAAQQAHPVGARRHGGADVAGAADVGGHLHVPSVGR